MALLSRIAFRYAKAFLRSTGAALSYEDSMHIERAANALTSNPGVLFYLKIPVNKTPELLLAVEKFLEHYKVKDVLSTVVSLLVKQNRLPLLPDVLRAIIALYREKTHLVTCIVSTAALLTEDQKAYVERDIAQRLGLKPEITYTIDKSLIAGIRIRAGFLQWEYSVAQQIRYLKSSVTEVYNGH